MKRYKALKDVPYWGIKAGEVYDTNGEWVNYHVYHMLEPLLEADVERLLQQKNEILLKAPLPDSERFALKEIRREVTYKQQAIDELKKLSN